MKVFVQIAFFLGIFYETVNGLSCVPCDHSEPCPEIQCEGLKVLGVCGCCLVCAKLEGEPCGGVYGIFGECDRNLICRYIEDFSGLEEGRCIRNEIIFQSSPNDRMVLIDQTLPGAATLPRLVEIPLSKIGNSFTVHLSDVNISATAVNPANGDIYWTDHDRSYLFRARASNFENSTLLKELVNIKSVEIDPLSGNVYYVDADTQTINVINSNGQYTKTLTSPPTNNSAAWKIDAMALDFVNKHLYWIRNNANFQQTELLRMKMDGTNQTLVLDNLNRTKHISINNQEQKMFLTQQVPSRENVFDSARLYEVPLPLLSNFSADDPNIAVIVYHVNFQENLTKYIQEFVISGSRLFLATRPPNGLQSVDLERARYQPTEENIDIVEPYIAAPFHLSLFSPSEANFFSSLPNPCQSMDCEELCLPTVLNSSVCGCRNGYDLTTNNRCRNSSIVDLPPSTKGTCPEDFDVIYIRCSQPPTIRLPAPQWSDDHTAFDDLIRTGPDETERVYPDGENLITYTATDSHDQVGICSYVVFVTEFTCRFVVRNLNSGMFSIQAPRCLDGQLVINVSCLNGQWIRYGNETNRTFLNTCQDNLQYTVNNYSLLSCVDPSTSMTSGQPQRRGVAIIAIIVVILVVFIIVQL